MEKGGGAELLLRWNGLNLGIGRLRRLHRTRYHAVRLLLLQCFVCFINTVFRVTKVLSTPFISNIMISYLSANQLCFGASHLPHHRLLFQSTTNPFIISNYAHTHPLLATCSTSCCTGRSRSSCSLCSLPCSGRLVHLASAAHSIPPMPGEDGRGAH